MCLGCWMLQWTPCLAFFLILFHSDHPDTSAEPVTAGAIRLAPHWTTLFRLSLPMHGVIPSTFSAYKSRYLTFASSILFLLFLCMIGLATYYTWVRAKHFGCPSVIPSVCYPGILFWVCKTTTLHILQSQVFLHCWKKFISLALLYLRRWAWHRKLIS